MGKKNKDVTVLILAGGLGTRLERALPNLPKSLAPIKRKPFLNRLLEQIDDAGFKKVILCTGYLGELIHEEFGKSYRGLSLIYSQEKQPFGTAGALRLAVPLIKSDLCLVMNGDSYINIDLNDFLQWHLSHHFKGSIVLKRMPKPMRYGTVEINPQEIVKNFSEKTDQKDPGWINAGVYLFHKSLLKSLPRDQFLSLERQVLPFWLKHKLGGYRSNGKFIDIGTPESLKTAETFFEKL
ncbi:MAG TPA: nucleotidyltransferase family protein [Acidobacteriota bacterium]